MKQVDYILRGISTALLCIILLSQCAQAVDPVKCLDYVPSSICSGTIKAYGVDRCRIDEFFGRYQCCWSCAAELDINIDANGRFAEKSGFHFYHRGCPDNVKDATNAFGESYTPWCMQWKNVNEGANCAHPLFQYRCHKTCEVSCGEDTSTVTMK
ncbi:deoxyribonuclease II family protein [Trichuris trichiura]|uniref:Deoxyribonuclease II family protein n=1 Tax=Trichuris trichiura TaxID=36087 RepID=A0A077Z899_TRITR|nr:deoxyribonuclease II family protein [Trichuris trichiura]